MKFRLVDIRMKQVNVASEQVKHTRVVIKEPDVPVVMSSDCDWKSWMTHDAVHLTPHWILCEDDKHKQPQHLSPTITKQVHWHRPALVWWLLLIHLVTVQNYINTNTG